MNKTVINPSVVLIFSKTSPLPLEGQRRLRGRENKVHDKDKKKGERLKETPNPVRMRRGLVEEL